MGSQTTKSMVLVVKELCGNFRKFREGRGGLCGGAEAVVLGDGLFGCSL
jgi:hypothetical protein